MPTYKKKNDKNSIADFSTDENDDAKPTEQQLAIYATTQVTNLCISLYEGYIPLIGKNDALGIVLEAQANSLGNMISLVGDKHQEEVIEQVIKVIRQGLVVQLQLVAELKYGSVGNA